MAIPKVFASSANPEQIALTWKGIIIGILPMTILIAKSFNVELAQDQLTDLVDGLFGAIAAIITFAGLARKFYYGFIKKS